MLLSEIKRMIYKMHAVNHAKKKKQMNACQSSFSDHLIRKDNIKSHEMKI